MKLASDLNSPKGEKRELPNMDKMEDVTDIPQITCEGKAESSCKVKEGKQQGKVWSSSFCRFNSFIH